MSNFTSHLTKLRIDAFCAENDSVYVQKGKFLGRYRYRASLMGDIPRSSINKFCESIGEQVEWTFIGCNTLYFNNDLVAKMVSAVADKVSFTKVVLEKEALSADAEAPWRETYAYRVFMPRWPRPSPGELLKKLGSARPELIVEHLGSRRLPDGSEESIDGVVAVLTSDDELMVLLKLLIPGVIVEAGNVAGKSSDSPDKIAAHA